MRTRPDILYVLSNGFASRMVLQSGVLLKLRERGLRVAVMSPNAGTDHFKRLCAKNHTEVIDVPFKLSPLLSHYGAMRRYLFEDFEKNAALRSKHLRECRQLTTTPTGGRAASRVLRAQALLGKAVNTVLRRTPRARALLSGAERRFLEDEGIRQMLTSVKPRMLVATYPVAWIEALSVLEAQRLGIPTVGQLLSWDNITCKGRFAAVPERFISWGPTMTQELRDFYGVGRDCVVEAGLAHFDIHARPVEPAAIARHLSELKLDPARPYLFFAMSSAYFAPREVDIVRWLAGRVLQGAFGEGMQLLVRPHPQTVRGPMADPNIVAKLVSVSGGRVAIDIPDVVSDTVDMGDQDMERLASLLRGAAVTLNSGSTVSIDAIAHDRPVIVTLFDASDTLPWWESARRIEEFPHIVKLLSHGGVAVARSFDDLEREVRAYLADPGRHVEARQRTREAQCGAGDGRACARIAEGLARFLSGAEPRRSGGVYGSVSR